MGCKDGGFFHVLLPHLTGEAKTNKEEGFIMNTLVIVLIAAVCLVAAYVLYGRWIARTWGIDENAKTPAVVKNDGKDYVPTDGWTVFSHQFSSIAGAGPVTGAIQAAVFGWVPVLLWILIGGVFFGAVTDFGALYASVKNEGKSMGLLIEKYIGKTGRKLFLLFSWLFCGLVIAAFADMVAGTFNAYDAEGARAAAARLAADDALSGKTEGGSCRYFVSDRQEDFSRLASIFLGRDVTEAVELTDISQY